MAVFVFVLLFTCTFMSCFLCSEQPSGQDFKLIISGPKSPMGPTVNFKVGETLNITCRITSSSNTTVPRFRLTMHPPYNPQNSKNRVTQNENKNVLSLIVQNLQETDTGDFKCQAIGDDDNEPQLHSVVRVIVKNKKKCSPTQFQCSLGLCIMKRYVCDGVRDCKNGEDESEEECAMFMDHDSGYMNEHPPQGLSCAMAFMFIVTILAIAICRVHMKRSSLLTRCPGARGGLMMNPAGNRGPHHHHGLQHVPLYDLDVLLNRPPYASTSAVPNHSGLLVTYNINNGVQFVGRPIDPPPYCEIVASPPREGPPPPYASRESLSQINPEASSTAQEDVEADDNSGEGDSLLGSSREAERARTSSYIDTLPQSLMNAGTVVHSSQQPLEEVDRNRQVGSAVSVILNNEVYDRNAVSSSDTICSFGTDDRVGELIVESGLSVSSCENLVVAPKVPDSQDTSIALSSMGVIGKPSGNTSHVCHMDSSSVSNKIPCNSQGEDSFAVVCDSQENPLQCLHDTFLAVHASSNNLNPGMVDAATSMVGVKSVDTAPNNPLGSCGRTLED
ncbi:hypothetical protein C0J52_17294 [Blattella germanica]|nr:hypothetical protein C0J52_17294 [Blattella germanica]